MFRLHKHLLQLFDIRPLAWGFCRGAGGKCHRLYKMFAWQPFSVNKFLLPDPPPPSHTQVTDMVWYYFIYEYHGGIFIGFNVPFNTFQIISGTVPACNRGYEINKLERDSKLVSTININ